MSDPEAPSSPPPSAAAEEARRRGRGCLFYLAAYLVMVVVGVLCAAYFRSESASPKHTVASGTTASIPWRVQWQVDEQQERCIYLYAKGGADPVTGGCVAPRADAGGADVHEAPLPTKGCDTANPGPTCTWVIFGMVPHAVSGVTLPLTDGTSHEVKPVGRGGTDDHFYVWVAPPGVHTRGDAVFG